MSAFTPSGGSLPSTATTNDVTVSVSNIYNVTTGAANSESSYLLPAGTKRFFLIARTSATLQLSYISGQTNIIFLTIGPGRVYTEDCIKSDATITLYFQSNQTNTPVEIVSWA